MSEEEKKQPSKAPKDLMGMLEYYLVTKAPFALPAGVKEWIVKYGPWIDVVLLILFLPVIMLALGLSAALMPFAMMGGATGFGLVSIILIVQIVLMVAALPGLFARKMSGWKLLFYSVIINLVYGLVNSLTYFGSILGTLISVLISLYLFQVKSLYKN